MIKPPALPSGTPITPVGPSAMVQRLRGDAAGRTLVTVAQGPQQQPSLAVGEIVSARLVEPLPNQQWAAVVKNAVFVLKLPPLGAGTETASEADDAPAGADPDGPSAEPLGTRGQVLSLRVATVSPRLTFVLASAWGARTESKDVALQLSAAARTLMTLSQASDPELGGGRSALPLPLIGLMDDPQATPAQRAQALALAVRQSGLFYESHLNAWSQGRLPLEQLKEEPQARAALRLAQQTDTEDQHAAQAELGRLVQKQLDALDGRPLALADQAWPGQAMEWHIARDEESAHGTEAADVDAGWTTQLNLVLPALGALGARLRVVGKAVQLDFDAADPATVALLNQHRHELALRLQTAGLSLAGMAVRTDEQAATPD